jgi:site-specific DNA-methyltransferase (cytosine-N4-specific)
MPKTTINSLIEESYTPPLPLFKVQGEPQVTLELKSYIQPFERVLARAELAGLLGLKEMKEPLEEEAKPYITIFSDSVPVETLQRRLAYWQRIGDDVYEFTLQVRYEATSNGEEAQNNGIEDLPKSRRLRYGPHDIHEYRGKFFPQLVKALINFAGLSEGATVLDPMCGSGTTICEARAMGMKAIGVDLNPLSVEISKLKADLLDVEPALLQSSLEQLVDAVKHASADRFNNPLTPSPLPKGAEPVPIIREGCGKGDVNYADDWQTRWDKSDLNYLLRWFDPKALQEIAQILCCIERVKHPTLRKMAEICLSNILRPISWQSDADLRIRKKVTEYVEGAALRAFIEKITRQQGKLIPYLSLLKNYGRLPMHEVKTGDARKLPSILPAYVGNCDALITSPPYATALPYIDTDRLSLIILSLLPRQEHRNREFQMIGNREVTESQRQELWKTYQARKNELPEDVCQMIDALAKSNHGGDVGFRRRNLPALLAKYFLDMTEALHSAYKMMRTGSYAFYVVGNNSTRVNGKRLDIPTNEFLWQIGKRVGWSQERMVDMELLPSRDIFRKNRGSSETILVFKARKRVANLPREISRKDDVIQNSYSTISRGEPRKACLRRQAIYSQEKGIEQRINGAEWNFHDEDTQPHLHALHPYPARFIPQIPRKAIKDWSEPGNVILDPFCGCGTAILESILLGRTAIGVDNNAVAHLISQAKTASYTGDDLKRLHRFASEVTFRTMSESSPSWSTTEGRKPAVWSPDFENLTYWFDERAILDLGRLKGLIEQLPDRPRLLALAVFSAIIVSVSYQDSDTRYARIDRPYQPGDVEKRFLIKLTDAISRAKEIIDLPKAESTLYLADSRNLRQVKDSSIDLIVTSPPYLNAYDYHKYHRQRLHWIEGDIKLARDCEIGKHDVFTRPKATPEPYFADMANCFAEWQRVLRPSGLAFIVIGDAIVSGKPVPVADRFLEILTNLGFQSEKHWIRQIPEAKKSFNRHNSRINEEHLLLFQRK